MTDLLIPPEASPPAPHPDAAPVTTAPAASAVVSGAPRLAAPTTPVGVVHGGQSLFGWAFVVTVSILALLLGGVALATNGSSGPAAAGGEPQTFEVSLVEFAVKPAMIMVEPGRPVRLVVTNAGTMIHDLKLNGVTGTAMLPPGASETVDLGAVTADSSAWCTVPGHRASGMELAVHVAGATAVGGSASGTTGAAAAADTSAKIDPATTPSADWRPFDPALQPAPGATVHDLTLRATEKVIEVAPGVTQEMWTFDDTVPGPILRGHVGDVFNVTLVNDGKMGHSIDFHASRVAWNEKMKTIQPGESLVYQYKAEYAGIFMYHCGTAPALHHIGNGMFGAVIIDPPGLPAVDHEYVFVQSELYLGPQGQPGDLAKMTSERFDAVVFNGYVNAYKYAPIRVEPGERIRAWVLDAGPSENSSFHIVGTVFDTVYKEGAYLLQPDATHGGSQALDLQAAQGGFVEFSFAEKGLYLMVTHKFANVGKGALGVFQAGEVEAAMAGH